MSIEKETVSAILRRLESGYQLPPLSVIAMKLMELASSETSSINDMVDLVEKDPSLTVRVLNLANSVFFSAGRKVSTLKQAAIRLGSNNLKMMALSISLRGAFPMGRIQQFDYEQFWRLSIYRALITRSLAEQSKVCNPEEAFIAGLTVEIGLPIFFDLYLKGRDEHFDLSMEPLEDLLARERKHYGVDHRQVGKAALKYWKFPEEIIACQSFYGEGAKKGNVPMLCTLGEMARLFSMMLSEESTEFNSFFVEAERTLKLHNEVIHETILDTFHRVQNIAESLKVEINKERDLMEIMEKANKALIRISERMTKYAPATTEGSLPSFESIDQEQKTVAYTLQAVAHEIRNPLTTVGGFAKRLAGSLDPHSQVGRYAQAILEEALRLEKILSTMPKQIRKPAPDSLN